MGQKVNPISLRQGLRGRWESRWFADKANFARQLAQDDKIRQFLRRKYPEGGIKDIVIFRNPKAIEVTIHTAKPGIIIGRSGKGMNEIKDTVQKELFQNVPSREQPKIKIHVEEIRKIETSARLVAESVVSQIEKRIVPRRAMKQMLEKLKEKGIAGAKIRVSGRLGGAEIARSEVLSFGSVTLHTLRMNIDYAEVDAQTTYGTIGVKVWLNLGEYAEDIEDEKDILEAERRRSRLS